jgi:hypothetical protein
VGGKWREEGRELEGYKMDAPYVVERSEAKVTLDEAQMRGGCGGLRRV